MNFTVSRVLTGGAGPSTLVDIPGRGKLKVRNTSANPVKIGFDVSSVVSCDYPVLPGETLDLEFSQATVVFVQPGVSNAEVVTIFVDAIATSYILQAV